MPEKRQRKCTCDHDNDPSAALSTPPTKNKFFSLGRSKKKSRAKLVNKDEVDTIETVGVTKGQEDDINFNLVSASKEEKKDNAGSRSSSGFGTYSSKKQTSPTDSEIGEELDSSSPHSPSPTSPKGYSYSDTESEEEERRAGTQDIVQVEHHAENTRADNKPLLERKISSDSKYGTLRSLKTSWKETRGFGVFGKGKSGKQKNQPPPPPPPPAESDYRSYSDDDYSSDYSSRSSDKAKPAQNGKKESYQEDEEDNYEDEEDVDRRDDNDDDDDDDDDYDDSPRVKHVARSNSETEDSFDEEEDNVSQEEVDDFATYSTVDRTRKVSTIRNGEVRPRSGRLSRASYSDDLEPRSKSRMSQRINQETSRKKNSRKESSFSRKSSKRGDIYHSDEEISEEDSEEEEEESGEKEEEEEEEAIIKKKKKRYGKDALENQAISTLKRTFSSILSKRRRPDSTSEESSTVSKSIAGTLERKIKNSTTKIGSNISLNLESLDKTRKKTFMFFTSQGGKGFIMSEDDQVTGIISLKEKKKSRQESFRHKIDNFTDTLRRRKKKSKVEEVPNFLWTNRPCWSSDSSLEIDHKTSTRESRVKIVEDKDVQKKHRFKSEVLLNIPNREEREKTEERARSLSRTSLIIDLPKQNRKEKPLRQSKQGNPQQKSRSESRTSGASLRIEIPSDPRGEYVIYRETEEGSSPEMELKKKKSKKSIKIMRNE